MPDQDKVTLNCAFDAHHFNSGARVFVQLNLESEDDDYEMEFQGAATFEPFTDPHLYEIDGKTIWDRAIEAGRREFGQDAEFTVNIDVLEPVEY